MFPHLISYSHTLSILKLQPFNGCECFFVSKKLHHRWIRNAERFQGSKVRNHCWAILLEDLPWRLYNFNNPMDWRPKHHVSPCFRSCFQTELYCILLWLQGEAHLKRIPSGKKEMQGKQTKAQANNNILIPSQLVVSPRPKISDTIAASSSAANTEINIIRPTVDGRNPASPGMYKTVQWDIYHINWQYHPNIKK